jgi:nucleoside-diphosphate-sugar epimerase
LNESEVQSLARTIGTTPDAMLYLAANGDPAASAVRPRWDLEANTVAFVTCLEHCPADHVVYLSSGAVYDGLTGAVTPSTAVSPRLPYAISKLASEQYLQFFAGHGDKVRSYVNVRFFGAYGPYEAPRKITTRWLRALADGQREFVIRGDGKNLIDFMYVDDAVDGFLALVKARGTRLTVDFASGAPVTVNDIVTTMAATLGVDVTVRHEGVVPEYIQFRSVDRTMRERFSVIPAVSFADGLKRLSAFLAMH